MSLPIMCPQGEYAEGLLLKIIHGRLMKNSIAIVGVGYVGLERTILFSTAGFSVIAYDQSAMRIKIGMTY